MSQLGERHNNCVVQNGWCFWHPMIAGFVEFGFRIVG